MFNIESQWPLPSKCFTGYQGIAFDGCWFYLTVRSVCRIVQFDQCFNEIKYFDTCRAYSFICYDPLEGCFWASDEKCFSTIFKLNDCFDEIDRISICIPEICESTITGISYNCCENTLMLSFGGGIISVDKECPQKSSVVLRNYCGWIMSLVSVCPYLICYCMKGVERCIRIYDCSGKLLKEINIAHEWMIESAVFFPCVKKCDKRCHFYVLVTKHRCYPAILDCTMESSTICSSIYSCNYDLCNNKCDNGNHCHKKPCMDILESIALVEASIAHILNAEGEKLQKVLASTDDVEKILEVNHSVNRTMEKAAHLEHLLYNKLEALNDCCDCGECSETCTGHNCNKLSDCIEKQYLSENCEERIYPGNIYKEI